MRETIRINGITLCHKHADGWVRSTLPDVCRSPSAPVPYVNTAFARDLADGTTTVRSHGGAMSGVKGSRFAVSIGDEPGVGGGVVSGVNLHEATWLAWSPNVFMEGRAVTRLTDKMLLNKGNTSSLGGYYTGLVTGPDGAVLEHLCEVACACKGRGNQRCVELTLMASNPDPRNGLWPEANVDYGGVVRRNARGDPSRRRGVPVAEVTRLDVVQLTDGVPTTIVEMKFAGDRFRDDQARRIDAIAKKLGFRRQDLDVERECACGDRQKQPVPVPAPQTEKEEQKNFVQRNPLAVAGGALAGIGAVACIVFEPCGAIVAGGALAVGEFAVPAAVVGGKAAGAY